MTPEDTPPKRRETRNRKRALQVYVTPTERAAIEANAKATGLTISTFLRNVGAGSVPRKARDLEAIDGLARVNADLARLGNLLKLYLQDSKPDHAAAVRLLADISELREEAKAAMRKVAA